MAAIVLIFCGFIVHSQLNYVLDKDLGFDKEYVFWVDPPVVRTERYVNDLTVYKNKIVTLPAVQNATVSTSFIDLSLRRHRNSFYIKSDAFGVTENFIPFYRIRILAGRNFRPDDRSDVIIISRQAAGRLDLKNLHDAVGIRIYVGDQGKEMEIVGIFEDFRLSPFLISPSNTESNTGRGYSLIYKQFENYLPEGIAVKLAADNLTETLSGLEKIYALIFSWQCIRWIFF